MASAVGLDIGRHSVKAAVVETTGRKLRLRTFVSAPIEPASEDTTPAEAAAAAIDGLFREHRLDRENVIASVDPEAVYLRDITLPFRQREQIDKVITYEAEHHIHACPADELVVDYYKSGEIGEKSRVLLAAARKDGLRERLDLLGECHIDPVDLDLGVVAIYNALASLDGLDEVDNALVLDVGGSLLQILVIEQKGLAQVAVRRVGAETATATTAVGLDPQTGDPANLVSTEGRALTEEEAEAQRQAFFERLSRSTRQFLTRVHIKGDLERIYITGGGARLPGLAEHLTARFGVPAEQLPLSRHLENKLSPEEQENLDVSGGSAVGLALKGLGLDRGGISLRRGEFAYQRRFDQVRLYLIAASMMLFLLAFVPAVYYWRLQTYRQASYALFTREYLLPEFAHFTDLPKLAAATSYTAADLKDHAERVRALPESERLARVERYLSDYNNQVQSKWFESENVPPIRSAFATTGAVFRLLMEAEQESPSLQADPMRIQDLDVDQRQLSMTLWAPTVEDLELIKNKLDTLSGSVFEQTVDGRPQFSTRFKELDGGQEVTIKATLREGE